MTAFGFPIITETFLPERVDTTSLKPPFQDDPANGTK